jgi:hypothetical protein
MKKLITSLVLVLLTLPLIASAPMPAYDGFSPDESVGDCSPYVTVSRDGSVVIATGGVSCLFTHPVIRIYVNIKDLTTGATQISQSKNCSGQSACETTSLTLPYVAGHTYKGQASIYFSSYNMYVNNYYP